MFVLRTGLQGNGKTLNTIKEVDIKAKAEGRTVYYHNLTDFKPDHPVLTAPWVEFDNPLEWYKLPHNAIIVIDEAQHFFRVRPQGSKVPEYASALETMRKQGHELHCITQNPKLIDAHFKSLCNSHIHYNRLYKGSIISRWEFERPINVDVKSSYADGQSKQITIDKRYFGVYKSVSDEATHHFKFRPPKALYVLLVAVILISVGVYRIYSKRISPDVEPVVASPVADSSPGSLVSGPPIEAVLTPQQYIDSRIPRVPDIPSSAPIYDQLTQPVSYPKPFCVSSRDEDLVRRNTLKMTIGYRGGALYGCRCNSQQGTRIELSFGACMNYVEHGYFDASIPDKPQGVVGVGVAEGRGTTTTTAPGLPQRAPRGFEVIHIPDNSRMPRTL